MKKLISSLFASLILLLTSISSFSHTAVPQGGIDLHAHLFMKEGMTWLFNGKFNGPLQAKDWKSRFDSQANPETLEKSGLNIVLATFYVHPLLTWSVKDSIRRQLQQVHTFVRLHPNWIIATHPEEARKALLEGKRVLILALEGASGILETDEDIQEFIDEGGIRVVTLLHLTDDEYGGVAFLKGIRAFASPISFIKSLFSPQMDTSGIRINSLGLTSNGIEFAKKLIQHHVWIDLAHASDRSQETLIPIMNEMKIPPLYTHTVMRKYHGAERGITEAQLQNIAKNEGFIGLMPSEEMLEGTPSIRPCLGGVYTLATQFQEIAKTIGESSIGIGSDFNGGIFHLSPNASTKNCRTGTSLDQQGLWNISQSQELWNALEKLNVWHPSQFNHTERFLTTWSRVFNAEHPLHSFKRR